MTSGKDNVRNKDFNKKEGESDKAAQVTTLHNPLDPNDDRKITLDDIDNEQKYKEAQTERD